MSEWRDIASAPKDGTIIKVRKGWWAPYHALWKNGGWQPIEFNGDRHPTLWLPSA